VEQAKAYIESGILELYVLGQLTRQEEQEVHTMASKFPEVLEEIRAIEVAMERYALHHSVSPRIGLDAEILHKLHSSDENTAANKEHVPVFKQHAGTRVRNLLMALAACITLLLGVTIALIASQSRLNEAKNQIATLSLQNTKFASTAAYMERSNSDLKKIAGMIDDPNWAIVKLAGTKAQPASNMMVYWNKQKRNVMVDQSRTKLPQNDPQHQYQLWALVNGKPVDLGVFDVKTDPGKILLEMKEIPAAQAFAVTLEKRGGSASPTMDQMVVLGNITI
jgi:anti-sigma-K factor RskA